VTDYPLHLVRWQSEPFTVHSPLRQGFVQGSFGVGMVGAFCHIDQPRFVGVFGADGMIPTIRVFGFPDFVVSHFRLNHIDKPFGGAVPTGRHGNHALGLGFFAGPTGAGGNETEIR